MKNAGEGKDIAGGGSDPALHTKREADRVILTWYAKEPVKGFHILRGTKKEDVQRGQVLAKPGSINPHKKFKAEIYVLSKEEGGRHTSFFNGYRPQFYFRTTDVTGAVTLPAGVEMVMPGDNVEIEVKLIAPIAMEKGVRFAIREGGRTVGAGQVIQVIA